MGRDTRTPLIKPNSHVLIFGLGLHGGGFSVLQYLRSRKTSVRVTDLRPKKLFLKQWPIMKSVHGTFGKHTTEDVMWADFVVKNPAVPRDHPLITLARKLRKPVVSDISLFFNSIRRQPDIVVTGTRGKSTTTALIGAMMKTKYNATVSGNIRVPVFTTISRVKKTINICELSSFQIEDSDDFLKPHIAVFTNIYTDHLNRYPTLDLYAESKAKLFYRLSKDDVAILNYDNAFTRLLAKKLHANIIFFSTRILPKKKNGIFIDKDFFWWQIRGQKKVICSTNISKLKGEHNTQNILAAIAVSKYMRISNASIAKVLSIIKTLEGRIELVSKKNGVTFINDTTATTPDALVAAFHTVRNQYPAAILHIIVGGSDKGLDFSILRAIKKRAYFYGLRGNATTKMKKILGTFPVFSSLAQAFKKAKRSSKRGDVIILSPGAASFNMFNHEFDRGDQFVRLVSQIKV